MDALYRPGGSMAGSSISHSESDKNGAPAQTADLPPVIKAVLWQKCSFIGRVDLFRRLSRFYLLATFGGSQAGYRNISGFKHGECAYNYGCGCRGLYCGRRYKSSYLYRYFSMDAPYGRADMYRNTHGLHKTGRNIRNTRKFTGRVF